MPPFNTSLSKQPPYPQGQAATLILRQASPTASFSMAQRGQGISYYKATLPPVVRPQLAGGNEDPPYNGWMSQFCVEPSNDTSTCCLGCWVPCALYGKTHWRLKQITLGKDASDLNWESKDGCNSSCWAWYGLTGCGLGMPLSGIVTGVQRSQIRGTYGIEGSCASDIALGICCTSCTQMQNDREIRAREGDIGMRYNSKYLRNGQDHRHVNTQPLHTQPMSYAGSPLASDFPVGEKKQPDSSEKPSKLQKKYTPVSLEPKPDHPKHKIEDKKRPTARELETQRQDKKKALAQNAPKITVTQYQDQPEKAGGKAIKPPGKKASIFGKFSSTKQETIPEEITLESIEPLSEPHTLVECDIVEVEDATNARHVKVVHSLVECTAVESISAEKSKSSEPQQHIIVESTTVQEEILVNNAPSGQPQHLIEDHETVLLGTFPSSVTSQDLLNDCDTVPVSEDGRPAQELSYVHDFTDCPVDKAILDFYEKEESKAEQHALTDRIRTSLPTELLQVNKPNTQHTLAECSEDEDTPPSSPSNQRSISYNIDRSNKDEGVSRQHRLVSCPTPAILSHHVAENALANASEDSEATQRPIYNDKLRVEEMSKSADGVSSGSGSGETNSGGSTEDPAVRRKQRRRHRKHRKATTQYPATNENRPVPVRSHSAQYSLEQVLAANDGKREQIPNEFEVESPGKQKGKDNESSAATIGEDSGNGIRSEEDPRSPGTHGGLSGLWSKITTPTKEKTDPAWS